MVGVHRALSLSLLALLLALVSSQSLEFGSIQGSGVQAGVEKMAQGLADVQNAANEKKQKFVDAAGNVYDVITDATGIATNLVRNKVGEVFDVTKMAGEWLQNRIAEYPDEAKQAGIEAAESLRATAADFRDFGREIGEAAKDAIPELPSKDNMFDRNQWISKMALNRMYFDRFTDTVESAFSDLFNGMEAKYCKPAELKPSVKVPVGRIQFPGGFKLKLSTTQCEIDKISHRNNTELTCRKPMLEFKKYPAKYISKHHTPVLFKTKLCKFEVSHGDADEIVLATFGDKEPVDLKAVMHNFDDAIVDAFSGDTEDAGMTEFYRLLPELADVEADIVATLVESMPDESQIEQMATYNPF